MQQQQPAGRRARSNADQPQALGNETEMVRVLDEDPELGEHLSARAFAAAAAIVVAPLQQLSEGSATFVIDELASHAHLGLLVLDGLLARHVVFGQIGSTEFLGPGDLLRPWTRAMTSGETFTVRWEVLTATRLAALDGDFLARSRPWPELTGALLDRTAQRADAQLLQSALRQAKRVEDRVQLALWHFAGRWGHIGPHGRTVQLPVTATVLAHVVGARRQSVSTALTSLAERGAIAKRPDGSWLIYDEPLRLDRIQPGDRATDQPAHALTAPA